MLTTYTLNTFDLDVVKGIHLGGGSPKPGINRNVSTVVGAGRDGNTPVPSVEISPVITLTVRVPFTSDEGFLVLLDSAVLTLGHDSREAIVELLSCTPSGLGISYTDYDITFRFPNLFWRDPSVATSTALTIASNPQAVSVFSGISAPIRDAIIRLKGSLGNPQVIDSRGSYFTYPATIPAGSYFRFESDTGRAFVAASNVWVGGTEVTNQIVNGPGPYFFELTPAFTTDIGVRAASLSVVSTSQASSPTIEVRAKNAYRV
jgi:hypothetical protein